MINLTVKTLDSRNHQFSVNDDMTVEEFKRHIADEVNISAETQRIIYCGRVLQDSSKLIDHDLDGKAVHLVQRAPPGTTAFNTFRPNRTSSPHPSHRMFRTLDTNNATVFLGSVYPSNLDTQGVLHPPTHTHAFTRLNVARRMLRRAEHLISQLENPAAPAEPAPQDDPQDEVLPIIEARLYYPGAHTAADESQIITQFFQNYLRRESQNSGNSNSDEQGTSNTASNTASAAPPSEPIPDTRFPENATRTAQLAEVLTTLSQVQHRFAPFLERYQNFMRDDPVVTSQEECRKIQTELDKVSEIMHFLSHAYHSISDVILRVRNSPPRPLLTRPLMLQQSAFVQTRMGIPIQVEAQINLSERPSGSTNGQPPSTGESAVPNTTAPTATPQPFSSQAVPMISTVRVPIPLEIRGILPTQDLVSSNTNLEAAGTAAHAGAAATGPTVSPSSNRSTSASTSTSFSSDPEVELIMEVTPEGISIDSLGPDVVRSNQTEDFLRGGSINGQQPANFIHTMMQMATELIHGTGRDAGASRQTLVTSATPLTPTPPAQNSQARGNNQTNPTSSTQTRSTPRPHVHLHHQNIPSGFDPYLTCHSHHVNRRRTVSDTPSTAQNQTASENTRPRPEERQNIPNDTLHGRLHGAVNRFLEPVGIGDPSQSVGEENALPTVTQSIHRASGSSNFRIMDRRYCLESVFGEFNFSGTYVNGESIFRDICMALYRTLSIRDILRLNVGEYSCLVRVLALLRGYIFRPLALETGMRHTEIVERFITESQGVLDTVSRAPIWGDVDIVATLTGFIRAKLPDLLELCARELEPETSDPPQLFEALVTLVKELVVLVFQCCNRDVRAADLLFKQLMIKHLRGLPEELLAWFAPNGLSFLTDFLQRNSNLISRVESYVVLRSSIDHTVSEELGETSVNEKEEEPMEVEVSQVELPKVENPPSVPKPEEVASPNVVNGTQPWHNQVPADWVPIITRDVQQQKKQNTQTPFSDAYLSGMPSKRRKIVHNSKSRHGIPLPQVVAESVRRAVNNTGLTGVAPLETVSRQAGASKEIQTAYRTLLRTSVQEGLRDNSDFNPERFPNAASYFFPK